MAVGNMYSLSNFGGMIEDSVRMEAYVAALRRAVKPDSVVLDIGTGAGIFAVLACKMGARKVFAIEPEDSIVVARQIAKENGCDSKIEFIQGMSTKLNLPEKVDVIIADLHGCLPLFQHMIPSMADARDRFLLPGGTIIPTVDEIWIAPASSPTIFDKHSRPWLANHHDVAMKSGWETIQNEWIRTRPKMEDLIAPPQKWATVDFRVQIDPNISGSNQFLTERAGISHGFFVWFNSHFADDIRICNGPDSTTPASSYGPLFFSWPRPVDVTKDDLIDLTLKADLVRDDYIFHWSTQIFSHDDPKKTLASFKQSSFFGVPLSLARLRKQADGYVPVLSEDGAIEREI
ncbi:MAG: methyltransferase domain-containing protein, partial [Planctomycetes bacterium]|nr:methyltransferase domain-containing protein [Planctomycetota bacterium]